VVDIGNRTLPSYSAITEVVSLVAPVIVPMICMHCD
jgi:hypothetical protein